MRARGAPGSRWWAVVFELWRPSPSLDAPASAERFFAKRGMSAVFIQPAANDWFQNPEIDDAIAAVRAATRGARLVGYGGSMGGYAAINFADRLGLDHVVAWVPQVSIDPRLAPWETRWREEAARIAFCRDRVGEAAPAARGVIVYDPFHEEDKRHAEAILARHPLTPLCLAFAGHAQMTALDQVGMFTATLHDLLLERLDWRQLRRRWRWRRRRSAAFWLGFAEARLRRGNAKAALAAIARKRRLGAYEAAATDFLEAEALLAAGEIAAARACLERWRNDPAHGELARYRLWRIGSGAATAR